MAGSNDHSIALRVLSGSAAGAEVPLVPGQRYSVGIDDEVDFIIDDPGIAGHHANLELDAGIVRMTPVESAAIELDGESFEGGIVPLYTAVQLGRTILAFGEEGESRRGEETEEGATGKYRALAFWLHLRSPF